MSDRKSAAKGIATSPEPKPERPLIIWAIKMMDIAKLISIIVRFRNTKEHSAGFLLLVLQNRIANGCDSL